MESRVQKNELQIARSVAGDERVGQFIPRDSLAPRFERVGAREIAALEEITGLSATTSDVLDELGWRLSVAAGQLPRRAGDRTRVVGHALTLRYLPARKKQSDVEYRSGPPRLAHDHVFRGAARGDVVVVSLESADPVSVLGGMAADTAVRMGIKACIVDGGVRDLEQIRASGLSLWAKTVTPVTGKWRADAVCINGPVSCGGAQVHPGDLVVADETGVCFVPLEIQAAAVPRILEVARTEAEALGSRRL